MKKLLLITLVMAAVVMISGTANAALLGLKVAHEGNVPDIDFNNSGVITYNATTDWFNLTAQDKQLLLPDGTLYWLSGTSYTTTLTLDIKVDENGNLFQGACGFDMIEKVTEGEVTIGDYTYLSGDVLLQADVLAFGWRYEDATSLPAFDFLLDTASGGLVTQGLWPASSPGTVLWADTATGTAGGPRKFTSWGEENFTLTRAKGDKTVTPEPTSLLLLGSGLLGLAALGRKKKKS